MSLRSTTMSRNELSLATAVVFALLLLVSLAKAGGPPPSLKLPADIVYSQRAGADSAVTFRHETHVALAGNRCLGCHPTPFRMLTPRRQTSHAEMATGGACGRCHDGNQAFGVTDPAACQTCHAGSRTESLADGRTPIPRRRLPPAIPFPRGESSPGLVTFRHDTHTKTGAACAACHPRPFAMKSTGGRPGGAMHASSACGRCHDGSHAFAVDGANGCGRCHAEEARP